MTGPLHIERRLDTPKWLKVAVPLASIVLAAIIVGILLAGHGSQPVVDLSPDVLRRRHGRRRLVLHLRLRHAAVVHRPVRRLRFPDEDLEHRWRGPAVHGRGRGFGDRARARRLAPSAAHNRHGPRRCPGRDALGVHPGTAARLPAHERDPHLAHAQLRRRVLHVLPDLRQRLLLARSYHARGIGVPDRARPWLANATWPGISIGSFVLPMGFVLGVGLAIGLLVLIRSTRYGFEMRVVGDSPQAANYRGHPHQAEDPLGDGDLRRGRRPRRREPDRRLRPRARPPRAEQAQYGYTGIVVAALALYNPLAVVIVSLLLGGLTNAGFALQGPSFPTGLVGTMEGIILFTVLGGEILARYRIGLRPESALRARRPRSARTGAVS